MHELLIFLSLSQASAAITQKAPPFTCKGLTALHSYQLPSVAAWLWSW